MKWKYTLNDEKQTEQDKQQPSQIIINSPMPGGNGLIKTNENTVYFYGDVHDQSALDLNWTLQDLDNKLRNTSKLFGEDYRPYINLRINSYGGSLFAGLAVLDFIRNLYCDIHTYVDGNAASAATIISIAGKKRFIGKNSFMLIHQLSSGAYGKYSELEDESTNNKRLMKTIKDIYKQYTKITMKQLDDILQHDLWFDSDTCLKLGLVDHII